MTDLKSIWKKNIRIFNSAHYNSLHRQLLAGFGQILMAMILASGLVLGYSADRTQKSSWRAHQEEAAVNAAAQVSEFLQNQEMFLSLFQASGLDELHEDPDTFRRIIQANPALLEVLLLDENGRPVINEPQEHRLLVSQVGPDQPAWFRQAQAGSDFYGNVEVSPAEGPYLVVAVPTPEGGVLASRLRAQYLWDVVSAARFGETGRAYLVNREGQIIAHPDARLIVAGASSSGRTSPAGLLVRKTVTGYQEDTGPEIAYIAGAEARVQGTDWAVRTEMSAREFSYATRTTWGILLAVFAVLYGVSNFGASRLLRRLVLDPVLQLQIGARQVGMGNLGFRIRVRSTDEIGQVAAAFNRMAESLGHHETLLAAKTETLEREAAERERAQVALQALNEELEARVEERTAQLSQAIADLRREVEEREETERLLQEHTEALVCKTYQQDQLIETARSLTASLDVQQVLQRIGAGAREIVEAFGCCIYLLEDDGQRLIPVVAIDPLYADELLNTPISVETSLNGRAIRMGRGLIINHPMEVEDAFQVPGTSVDTDERLIVAPLRVDGEVLGSLCLNRTGIDFTPDELALAETFAAYASAALKNAQAHTDLQHEVAERARAEQALRESEERFTLATRGANDGIWDWDIRTNRVYFSPRWKSILGHEDGEVSDDPAEWLGRLHPEDAEGVKVTLSAHLQGLSPHFESEHRIRHKDGSYRWVLSRGLAVREVVSSPGGPVLGPAYRMAGSQSDITDRKVVEEQLAHGAFHDALTGLPNRALFLDRLGRVIQRTNRHPDSPFAVLFLDLDRFKVINDSLGHPIGDQLLVALSRRLSAGLRISDTAARLGGDEFVILLDEIGEQQDVVRVAERIHQELKQPFNLDGHEVVITASIGIVRGAVGYEKPEDVLRDADIALYRAKGQGKNCYVVFDASLRTRAVARMEMEGELRRGLDRGEFSLKYQPIRSLATDQVIAFEALLRWESPTRGPIPPVEFIPLAEETGLIVPIGEWVLREACGQLRRWQDQFPASPPLAINVNISGVQFAHPALLDQVKAVLEETGVEPSTLRLEITESVFMENADGAQAILAKLHKLGVQLQIDDFGTGYSSLAYLQRFPISTIKIDRSFVSRITRGEDERGNGLEIIKTIVALARDLGMSAVAEGVETIEQLDQLRGLGCQFGQGFLFARPLDEHSVEALLEEALVVQ